MGKPNPTHAVIVAAIDKVERYGLPMTTENVKANVDVDALTLGDMNSALWRHLAAQIPVVMRDRGLIIADTKTRERKDFWASTPDELEEQKRIKEQSNDFDRVRITCDEAVITFLREKEKEFGYEVYPGLFHSDIDRIYAMHGLSAPSSAA